MPDCIHKKKNMFSLNALIKDQQKKTLYNASCKKELFKKNERGYYKILSKSNGPIWKDLKS